MFDIGLFEFVALAVIALVVFGPDKLPKMAADAARLLRELKQMASGARRELSEALGPELSELKDLQNLDPRGFVKRNFLDVLDEDDTEGSTPGDSAPGPTGSNPPPSGPSSPRGYDDDTT
jgi:sec-independent protein translocase protein TatB